jgi:hypothetical protein
MKNIKQIRMTIRAQLEKYFYDGDIIREWLAEAE